MLSLSLFLSFKPTNGRGADSEEKLHFFSVELEEIQSFSKSGEKDKSLLDIYNLQTQDRICLS